MKTICLLLLLTLPALSFGQLTLGGNNPYDLVNNVLAGSGAQVSNVVYTGFPDAVTYFQASAYNMPFASGVLLTTGTKWSSDKGPHGPNSNSNAGMDNKTLGWDRMTDLIGQQTYNASILDFDIIPQGDSILIKYIFASEEYPEYIGSKYKDLAVIFISGPGIDGVKNIALLPHDSVVTINNVHSGGQGTNSYVPPINSQYFVYNGDGTDAPYRLSFQYIQYDGFTVPLTARQKVIPGETYHLSLGVADVGDGVLDSGLFLEAGSLTVSVPENDAFQASVCPNPVNDELFVTSDPTAGVEDYSVIDAFGKIILSGKSNGNQTLNLADFTSGIYFLTLNSNKASVTKKIMKM